MKKKPKTGILQRFFKIICLAVTLTSAGFLIYHMVYLPMENKKLVAELKGNFPEPEAPGASGSEKKDQPAGRKCPVAAVDLVSLREQYPDVQGWLTIPDTGIDYPVLQSEQENGEFYLKRNYKKEYDINGSLFLQADCKVSESRNLIIYGHNINGRRYFGYLQNFREETFFKEHPVFSFTPVEGKKQDYHIVSILETDKYADYYSFTDYGNEKDYYGMVEKILSHSKFQSKAAKKMKKKMDESDAEAFFRKYKFVTLSTCRTMDGRDKRLMVIGCRRR